LAFILFERLFMTPSLPENPILSKAMSVSDLNRQVKRMLEVSYGQIWVSGEISGLSRPSSGHWYFSLKDNKAQIRCAMFRGFNQRVRFQPKEGELILVRAKVSLYEGRGDYQLIVEGMEPAGLGQLQADFEALKRKLSLEGLFDEAKKKPIPNIPNKVAVITSESGAVIHDIISVTKRRFPALEIILLPVSVQGDKSAAEIAQAISFVNQHHLADTIIVGRGGGSLEDLWAFNEEIVARAIFASALPIISAVGHEVDFTIADLVADYRAPTPSAAAEKVTPDQFELMQQLDQQQRRLDYFIAARLQTHTDKLQNLQHRLKHPGEVLDDKKITITTLLSRLNLALKSNLTLAQHRYERCNQAFLTHEPSKAIQQNLQTVDYLYEKLLTKQCSLIESQQHRLSMAAQTLNTASPLATLSRGYAILAKKDKKGSDKKVVSSSLKLKPGDQISATLQDGVVHCTVDQSVPKLEF
jgi:exodeoxyribonuclease VII large subunit